jgi:hypothetical protein
MMLPGEIFSGWFAVYIEMADDEPTVPRNGLRWTRGTIVMTWKHNVNARIPFPWIFDLQVVDSRVKHISGPFGCCLQSFYGLYIVLYDKILDIYRLVLLSNVTALIGSLGVQNEMCLLKFAGRR